MTIQRRAALLFCGAAISLLAACGGDSSGSGTGAIGGGSVPPIVPVEPILPPVIAVPSPTGRINDTGINSASCYKASSDTLVPCNDANAIALNPAQDGAIGRDVDPTTNLATDGKLGFSYTKIGSIGEVLPADAAQWSCVKDNVTGLIWEVKTSDGGLRDFNKRYTNLDGTTPNQLAFNPIPNPPPSNNEPSSAQIAAPTNTVAYTKAVNALGLCGNSNWRLPTASELASLADHSVAAPGPTIDTNWFGATGVAIDDVGYWTSTQLPFFSEGSARVVYFYTGGSGSRFRNTEPQFARLVRSS